MGRLTAHILLLGVLGMACLVGCQDADGDLVDLS